MSSSNLLRGFNFLFFALLAMFISFLPVYLDAEGISVSNIGLIIGTGGVVAVFSQPFWGVISDKRKTVKKVILLLLVLSSITGYFLYQSDSFIILLVLTMAMYFFLLPIDPLIETLNFQTSQKNGVSYGSIRTYGAVGYAVMSLIVGYVVHYFGSQSLALLFVAFGIISLLVCAALPDAAPSSKPVTFEGLKQFFSYRKTRMFLFLIFLAAVPNRINDQFLGVYIRELGGSVDLVGQAWFFSAGSEILVFALSFWWLRKGREVLLITVASAFYIIRFVLSYMFTDPQVLTLLQFFQAFTFPVFYSAAIQYLYQIVPEEWKATGQTVLAILFFGVSGIAASYIGGWFYESFGGRSLYLFMSTISGMAFLYSLYMAKVASANEVSPSR